MVKPIAFCAFTIFAVALPATAWADLPSRIGGGNIGRKATNPAAQFRALQGLGAGMCRLPVHPGQYGLARKKPNSAKLDPLVLMAHEHGVEPLLLFEYYTAWDIPLGGHKEWFEIGRYHAARYAPNSDWLRSHGIEDWGVRNFSAINEPAQRGKRHNPEMLPLEAYAEALEGLADGVHSIDSSLHVSPAGWSEIPLHKGRNKFPQAVAPLFNNGKLHAICIHRYWDVVHVPMEGTYDWSLQSQFEAVKASAGITADIAFCTDEFNFKFRKVTERQAAQGFLTALWDAATVVGKDGQVVSQFFMPWNIFHVNSKDHSYGLCSNLDPWTPIERGKVLQLVCRLTKGMELVSADPKRSGISVLEGDGKKLWVWQNRRKWSNRAGRNITLRDLPATATIVEIYGWDGLRDTVEIGRKSEIEIRGLPMGETYMLLARKAPTP